MWVHHARDDVPAENDSIEVECSVRTPLVLGPVDDHVETLRGLDTGDIVDAVVFRSWPHEITLDDDEPAHEAVDRYERFRPWAANNDVSIRPPFEVRTRTSPLTDERQNVLVTPRCCLAVYVDERLVGIYPHSQDDETYTAESTIDELRDGDLPGTLSERSLAGEYPSCNGPLDNGQGLYACPVCEWVGWASSDGGYVQLDACRLRNDERGGHPELTTDQW